MRNGARLVRDHFLSSAVPSVSTRPRLCPKCTRQTLAPGTTACAHRSAPDLAHVLGSRGKCRFWEFRCFGWWPEVVPRQFAGQAPHPYVLPRCQALPRGSLGARLHRGHIPSAQDLPQPTALRSAAHGRLLSAWSCTSAGRRTGSHRDLWPATDPREGSRSPSHRTQTASSAPGLGTAQ